MKCVAYGVMGSVLLSLAFSGCKSRSAQKGGSSVKGGTEVSTEGDLDAAMGEELWKNEAQETEKLKNLIVGGIVPKEGTAENPLHPPEKMMRRDAHPKAHGCVEAEFNISREQVEKNRSNRLDKGLFAKEGSYRADIRFSNGSGNPKQADNKPDGRGMAVKVQLADVGGLRLTNDGENTQDFIMINYPEFFVARPSTYEPVVKAVQSGAPLGALPVLVREPLTLYTLLKLASINILNPLHETYFSEVPYRLGEQGDGQLIKFSATPVACAGTGTLRLPGPVQKTEMIAERLLGAPHNYLREEMAKSLNPGVDAINTACFDFQIQRRAETGGPSVFETAKLAFEDTANLLIDGQRFEKRLDPRIHWTEAFETVAQIVIRAQDFSPNDMKCEQFSFSPWDGISAHRPLGGVNRMRKVIYKAVSDKRHGVGPSDRSPPSQE